MKNSRLQDATKALLSLGKVYAEWLTDEKYKERHNFFERNLILKKQLECSYYLASIWHQQAKNHRFFDKASLSFARTRMLCELACTYYEKFIDIIDTYDVAWVTDKSKIIFEEYYKCKILQTEALIAGASYKKALECIEIAEMLLEKFYPEKIDVIYFRVLKQDIKTSIAEEVDEDE